MSGCALRGLVGFLSGREVAACERGQRLLVAAPYVPVDVDSLDVPPGLSGLSGRTAP